MHDCTCVINRCHIYQRVCIWTGGYTGNSEIGETVLFIISYLRILLQVCIGTFIFLFNPFLVFVGKAFGQDQHVYFTFSAKYRRIIIVMRNVNIQSHSFEGQFYVISYRMSVHGGGGGGGGGGGNPCLQGVVRVKKEKKTVNSRLIRGSIKKYG